MKSQLGLVKGRSSGSLSDGHLVCKFSRYKSVDKSDPESEDVFDLGDSHQYYIILASGKTSSGTSNVLHICWLLIIFLLKEIFNIFMFFEACTR